MSDGDVCEGVFAVAAAEEEVRREKKAV